MTIKHINKEKQRLARYEKSLALAKYKLRKTDTRRKIELGGLVIKSGIDGFNKATILGALDYSLELLMNNPDYKDLFENRGNTIFLK